ncbi:DUF4148 domain-containing protein [Bordetella sp. N]|uniref:DUF4148 domain-containing protein n=1 Tax=Bordetella sp. N TaxID=1746199 RepID=UPI00070BE36E|nr:DUF4148 domain-containing protein [Bordetella sp. N]ALM83873.1 hypothetical protein ASB57_13630 [Bordetella sp. N]
MKTRTLSLGVAALSFALMGAAHAGPAGFGDLNNQPFQGVYGAAEGHSLTRAEVVQQLQQAKAAGYQTVAELDAAPFQAASESNVSRAQVAQDNSAPGATAFGDYDNQPFQGVYASTPSNTQSAQANDGTYVR